MSSLLRSAAFAVLTLSSTALAEDVQPYRAHEIAPVRAHDIAPVHAHEIVPVGAHELTPVQAQVPSDANSGSLAVHHAKLLQVDKPAGVTPVPHPGPIDTRLVGQWRISIPSVSWTTRTEDGPNEIDTTHSGVGAAMGLLRIDSGGHYRWTGNGHHGRGTLEEVAPNRDAAPNARYWLVRDGAASYYLTPDVKGLTLYAPRTNLYAASGTPVR